MLIAQSAEAEPAAISSARPSNSLRVIGSLTLRADYPWAPSWGVSARAAISISTAHLPFRQPDVPDQPPEFVSRPITKMAFPGCRFGMRLTKTRRAHFGRTKRPAALTAHAGQKRAKCTESTPPMQTVRQGAQRQDAIPDHELTRWRAARSAPHAAPDRRDVEPVLAGGRCGPRAPRVTEHDFELARRGRVRELRVESFPHPREAPFPGQRAAPSRQAVTRARRGEIAKQRRTVRPGDRQPVDVEHGIREAGPQDRVADVVHVREGVDVHVVVDRYPGVAQLAQGVGPERRERE